MFTDIVTSTDLIGVVGDEAWAELLAWHNRELRSSFSSHRGEEVKSTGDGFFVTFDDAGDGDRMRGRHPAAADATPARARVRAVGADRSPRIRATRMAVTTAVGASTSRPASVARPPARRSWSRRGSRAGRAHTVQGLRAARVTLKGVREPVDVRAIDWR